MSKFTRILWSSNIELADAGFQFEVEKKIKVYYRGKIVGGFSADLIVYEDDELILEPKLTRILIQLILQIQ